MYLFCTSLRLPGIYNNVKMVYIIWIKSNEYALIAFLKLNSLKIPFLLFFWSNKNIIDLETIDLTNLHYWTIDYQIE
jgi:hypothetical protein